jgi:hypothetical protein
MAVSAGYLAKLQRAVRIKTLTADASAELTDLIEECRRDMEHLGVLAVKTTDETDSLILGAVRCYVRWKMAQTPEDEAGNRMDYAQMRDELRRHRDYIGYTVTFAVTDGTDPLADAEVTFDGDTITTGAAGTAVFYGVDAGAAQEYTIEREGYETTTDDVEITATATITVAMSEV